MLEQVPAFVICIQAGPIDPRPPLRLERLDTLELDIEIELQAGDVVVWQVRESRVPEGIIFLEQHQDGEIADFSSAAPVSGSDNVSC